MLFASVPPSFISSAVCPEVFSVPFFLIFLVLPVVLNPVGVHIMSVTLHIILVPLAIVTATVSPLVNSTAVNFVVEPFSIIGGSVHPSVPSLSLFLRFDVLSFKLRTFRPFFSSLAMLLVVLPLTLVSSSFDILVDAPAICFVIHPIAVIGVIIGMVEHTLSVGLIILPETVVPGPIRPLHDALSVAQASQPLPVVLGISCVGVLCCCDRSLVVVLLASHQCLHGFIFLEIPGLHLRGHGNNPVLSSVEPAPNQRLDPGNEHYIIGAVDVLVELIVSETYTSRLTLTSLLHLFYQLLVALDATLAHRLRRCIPGGAFCVLLLILLAYCRHAAFSEVVF